MQPPHTISAAGLTALVLAGRRGASDPLAQTTGCSHRALVPVGGQPMLVRVVHTLQIVPQIQHIAVSIDDASVLDGLTEVGALKTSGVLKIHHSEHSPSMSVQRYLEDLTAGQRLLVTTADHPLLTTEMVQYFNTASENNDADVSVGIVPASLVRALYPQSLRTVIPLRGESYCGANLFSLRAPQAGVATAFWRRAEQFRKRPWRLARMFGLVNLLLFACRCINLDLAVKRASRVIGVRVAAVSMPFAECAIDVDTPADLALASHILDEREAAEITR
jgi:GTP:adenosylcobinamide-phosphate guanylyltransferase